MTSSKTWKPSARNGPIIAYRRAGMPDHDATLAERKARFDGLNKFVISRGGWITSIPGAREVVVEAVSATIASDLAGLGYSPIEIEGGQRIIAGAIEERFVKTSSGAYEPWAEGSTKPIAEVRRHAGICPTRRYRFMMD